MKTQTSQNHNPSKLIESLKFQTPKKLQYPHGPLNKNEYTKLLERIIDHLTSSDPLEKSKLSFKHDKNKNITVKIEDSEWNLSEILPKADLTQIKLKPEHLDFYQKTYKNEENLSTLKDRINRADPLQKETLSQLNDAEIIAINRYTGYNYTIMNALCRGQKTTISYEQEIAIPLENLGNNILAIAVASSGLNKLPLIDLPTVCRGERSAERKKFWQQAGDSQDPFEAKGFLSSSTAMSTAENFKGYNDDSAIIIFENIKGLSISAISEFPNEHEYLIPPGTQIRLTGMNADKNIFSAEQTNVLLNKKTTTQEKLDNTFNKNTEKVKDKTLTSLDSNKKDSAVIHDTTTTQEELDNTFNKNIEKVEREFLTSFDSNKADSAVIYDKTAQKILDIMTETKQISEETKNNYHTVKDPQSGLSQSESDKKSIETRKYLKKDIFKYIFAKILSFCGFKGYSQKICANLHKRLKEKIMKTQHTVTELKNKIASNQINQSQQL